MKKIMMFFLLATVGMLAQVKENRNVTEFNKVAVSNGIELYYAVANKNKVTVEADSKESLKNIKTEVKANVLRVYRESGKKKWGSFSNLETIKVFVEGPNLEGVKVSSSAQFIAKDLLKSDDFDLEASSSGYFKGDVKANNCTVSVSSSAEVKSDIKSANYIAITTSSSADFSGTVSTKELRLGSSSSSDMVLTGDVKVLKATLSSSSTISAKNLKIRELNVAASSSSTGSFQVSEKIEGTVSSSATIRYTGNPTQVNVKKSSSGKISKA